MRNKYRIFHAGRLASLLWVGALSLTPVRPGKISQGGSGFVLLELFTSEGCSSCPAADEVIARLAHENRRNVFILGFHVDYWNNLGWRDGFSQASYSHRQQEYGSVFHLSSIYTPQLIVNGRFQQVGSDERRLRNTLEEELKSSEGESIEANAGPGPAGAIKVSYRLSHRPNELLRIALVQLYAESSVTSGENRGRHLQHVDLVRDFQSVDPGNEGNGSGSVLLKLPDKVASDSCRIVLFLQNRNSMQVTGATKIGLR
jgi:hypothetical protein